MTYIKQKISVLIPTKNRRDDIIRCIESIIIQSLLPDEIIVVDASDTQELNDVLTERFRDKLSILYAHSKPGTNSQRNIGIDMSGGDIVFFLDDDVILEQDFIEVIIKVFEKDTIEKIGGVCGNVIDEGNNKESRLSSILKYIYSGPFSTLFFLSKKSVKGKFRLSGFPTYPYGTKKETEVECLPSGLTAFRRKVLDEFKWDEKLAGPTGFCYMDDDDFSFRVSRKYTNIFTPYARVIHKSSPVARDKKFYRMKLLIKNHHYLFKKNIPQTLQHKFAFYMSILGLLITEMINIVLMGDAGGLKGLVSGIREIHTKKNT